MLLDGDDPLQGLDLFLVQPESTVEELLLERDRTIRLLHRQLGRDLEAGQAGRRRLGQPLGRGADEGAMQPVPTRLAIMGWPLRTSSSLPSPATMSSAPVMTTVQARWAERDLAIARRSPVTCPASLIA